MILENNDLVTDDNNPVVEDEEEEDELQVMFDSIPTSGSIATVEEYQKILTNSRIDEIAIKIKEKCIIRFVNSKTWLIYTSLLNDVVELRGLLRN